MWQVYEKPWTTPLSANRTDGHQPAMTGFASPPVMVARAAAWVESGCEAKRLPDHSHEHAALAAPGV